jgi:predicted Zn-dependent peptidase
MTRPNPKRQIQAALLVAFILGPLLASAWAQPARPAGFSDKVKEFSLGNGMRFLVYPRRQVPTFAGMIMVKVGSVDEGPGITGLAHFFEHMAFKGTAVIGTKDYAAEKPILDEMDPIGDELAAENLKGAAADPAKIKELRDRLSRLQEQEGGFVVKDELDKIYSENGGEFLNASTGPDTTQFFVMLPANRLELWFLIESERFKNPVFREFYSERDVVAEERRMGEDNDADSFLNEEYQNVAFILHPYRHPVVGYMEDIQTFTKDKAVRFFRTYYTPNNMTAAVVGDVKLEDVQRLATAYFGDMPRGPEPPRPVFLEPAQKGERRVMVRFDAEPSLVIGYHMPAPPDRDNLVLGLIASILSRGASSRLERDLVTNRKLALYVEAYGNSPGARYPSLFEIYGAPRYPHTPQELEQAVLEHLERLKTGAVTKDELDRAVNQSEASLYRSIGFAENVFLAMRLLRNVVIYNDLDADFKRVEALRTITPQDIRETAGRIFREANRTVGTLLKKGSDKTGGER